MNTRNLQRDTARILQRGVRWRVTFYKRPLTADEQAKAAPTLTEINNLLASSRTKRLAAAEANCIRLTKKNRL